MITITIDCGASFIKGAAFENGIKKTVVSCESPSVHDNDPIFEIQLIKRLLQSVRQMVIDLAGDEKEANLCISNEMHGFILAHGDGEPYTDYISWQKEFGSILVSGKSSYQLLSEDSSLQRDILHTGMPLRAGLPSCNLLYLSRTGGLESEGKELHFYTLGSYILKALSGIEPMEHPTNAAATGLYDLKSEDWNWMYIEKVGARRIRFPKIGQESIDFTLNEIMIHALPALGDQQAALLGAGFSRDTDLSFNLGTGAQVSCLVKAAICTSEYQIRPYFYGKYLKTIPHIPSGRALNVFFRFVKSVLEQYNVAIGEPEIWSGILRAGETGNDTGMKVDLGFFENTISPNTVGSVSQIEEYAFSLGNLVCSVLRQMADNFINVAERLEPDSCKIERLVFSGGISRRIETIRKDIIAHYPQVSVLVASDETLLGLYEYSKRRIER